MTSDGPALGEVGHGSPSGRPDPQYPSETTATREAGALAATTVRTRSGRRRDSWRGRWLLIPVMGAFFGIISAFYVLSSTVTYSASALVQVDAAVVAPGDSPDQIDDQEMATQRLVMSSDAVAGKVIEDQRLSGSVTAVQKTIAVAQVMDSRVLRVTATRDSPAEAASLANAFAAQYLVYRAAQRDESLAEASGTGESVLRPGPVGTVLTPAVANDAPSGPRPALVITVSIILGLVIGAGLLALLERRRVARTAAS